MARNRTSRKTIEFLPRRLSRNRPRGYPRRSHKRLEIFGPLLLVEKESPALYEALLEGLIRDLNPIGTAELAIVEKLATNIWRQRRLIQAEAAEIGEAAIRNVIAIGEAMHREAWDAMSGGSDSEESVKSDPDQTRGYVFERLSAIAGEKWVSTKSGYVSA